MVRLVLATACSSHMQASVAIVAMLIGWPAKHRELFAQDAAQESSKSETRVLYFPPADGPWEKIKPEEVGWDEAKLKSALDWAGDVGSSGVVILLNGRILAEQHWVQEASGLGLRPRPRSNRNGHAMEDVASVQKSITSLLVGLALQKRLLKLDDPVSMHLGVGWSKASEIQEARIKIRHLLTMTSGLSDDLEFVAKPGTKWRYNTPAYARVRDCVVAAAGQELNELTREWLTHPLGMRDSRWLPRPAGIQALNAFGFSSTARDLARIGLLMQADGRWEETRVFDDSHYLEEATTASQQQNLSYGYLWWLNQTERVASAPRDMYSANGAKTRRLYVIPSQGLVITRIGVSPKMNRPRNFDAEFLRRILAAKEQ